MRGRLAIIVSALPLTVSIAVAQDPASEFSAHAIVRAADETVLSAEMAGRIKTLPFDEGDSFAAGKHLAGFNCDILEAEQAVARATTKGAEAQLQNAKRLDRLGAAGSLDLALAEAALEEAQANLSVANARLRRCVIIAPFDGFVLERDVERFESVEVMTPLLRIGRPGTLRVEIIAPALWLSWMETGKSFQFMPHKSDTSYAGTVERIGAVIDAASQTVKIEGKLTVSASKLRSGMGGGVLFHTKTNDE